MVFFLLLLNIFSHRITTTFKQRDGLILHVRKSTVAEPKFKKLYDALGLCSSTAGIKNVGELMARITNVVPLEIFNKQNMLNLQEMYFVC